MHDERIDDRADVVNRPIAEHRNASGLGIHFQLAQMRAVAECEARRIIGRIVVQAWLDRLQWKIVRDIGSVCDGRE